MSRGLNKAQIIGNLGADPDVRFTAGGAAVANLNVATSRAWKDKETGELKEETEWHRCVMFSRLAEVAQEYLHKGSKVYIEGRLQTRKWENKEGVTQYSTEIVANEMQMLDSKGDNTGGQQPQRPQQRATQQQAPQQIRQPDSGPDDMDDSSAIPF